MTSNFLIPALIDALCASAFAEDSATTKGIIDLNKTDLPEDAVVSVRSARGALSRVRKSFPDRSL